MFTFRSINFITCCERRLSILPEITKDIKIPKKLDISIIKPLE